VIGSSPTVLAPSDSSTIAAGSRCGSPLSGSVTGARAASSPSASPSPIAVLPLYCSASIPDFTRALSVVGSTSCDGVVPKLTRPSRKSRGSLFASARAASLAAVMRSGATSFAFIEPDMSVTITTVAARCSAATVRSGRPSATSSDASASSASAAGMWRAQPARLATLASTSTFVYRTA
jgi:hypothetical protein